MRTYHKDHIIDEEHKIVYVECESFNGAISTSITAKRWFGDDYTIKLVKPTKLQQLKGDNNELRRLYEFE